MQLPVDPANPTLGMQSVAVTYCAHANNTPAAEIATNGNACPAGLVPWQMNCLMMGFAGSMGDVVLFNNLTLLQTLGQPDLASFESYALANAPAEYLSSQPDPMSGCVLSGAVIIIAVFALMQGGQGFGTLMGALDPLSKGLVGAGTLSEVVRRTSPIDGFSTDGATPTSGDTRMPMRIGASSIPMYRVAKVSSRPSEATVRMLNSASLARPPACA